MQKIPLPDGQFLNLPDDLPQGIRDQVAAEAQAVYGIDINDVSFLERVAEFPRSVVRGAAQTLLDVPTDVAFGEASKVPPNLIKSLPDIPPFATCS